MYEGRIGIELIALLTNSCGFIIRAKIGDFLAQIEKQSESFFS